MKKRPVLIALRIIHLVLAVWSFGGTLHAEVLQDEWARVLLAGNQIGFYHVSTEKIQEDGKDVYVSSEESNFSMRRAGIVLNLTEKSKTREDETGRVLSFKMERRMGGDLMEVSAKSEGDQLVVIANGMTSTAPYPETALGPRKIDVEMRQKGFAPGTTSTFSMFDREDPSKAATLTTTILPKEKLKIGDEEKEWVTSNSNISNMPGMTVKTWADDEGNFRLIRVPLGAMGTIEMEKSTKELAMQEAKPAEMFINTLIRPSRPVPNPEKLKEAVYLISAPKGKPVSFYSGEGQKVEAKENNTFQITVTLPVAPSADTIFKDSPIREGSFEKYLKPSPFLQSDDPGVIALARQIAGDENNALTLANRIQQGVYLKISNKNLATGIASAASVAKTLEGDCTEHAVLSAAIARALGLPSRIVVGLVYAPSGGLAGYFGYHMWAEILVAPECWWPVDAAFGRYDVTHIAMAKSALEKPSFESELVTPFLQAMGEIKINVQEFK